MALLRAPTVEADPRPVAHHTQDTYRGYKDFLQDFCELYGTLLAKDLKPLLVSRWLDVHPGWNGSRRNAVVAVKRAFNWADAEGVLQPNPVKSVKKPPQRHRDRVLTPEERREILRTIPDQHFRDFVFAMQENRGTAGRGAEGDGRARQPRPRRMDLQGAQDRQAHRPASRHLPDAGDSGADQPADGEIPGRATLPRATEQARLHP
jgi:hypothetical protein